MSPPPIVTGKDLYLELQRRQVASPANISLIPSSWSSQLVTLSTTTHASVTLEMYEDSQGGVGGHTWLCCYLMAFHLMNLSYFPNNWYHNKSIVELGSGTGLLSLLVAKLGATRVVATDQFQGLALLNGNIRRNGGDERVAGVELNWGDHPSLNHVLSTSDGFDMIIMSECCYNSRLYNILLDTVEALSKGGKKTLVVIGYEIRGMEDQFVTMCENRGYSLSAPLPLPPSYVQECLGRGNVVDSHHTSQISGTIDSHQFCIRHLYCFQ